MAVSTQQLAQMRRAVEAMMGDVISAETYTGENAAGAVFAAATSLTVNIGSTKEGGTRIMKAPDGTEIVVQDTFQAKYSDVAKLTPETRITMNGSVTKVIAVERFVFAGQLVYVEVGCG